METTEIMTAQELARYLRLAEATIYKLAQEGKIPAVKVGRTWRFKKELIDDWFRQQANVLADPEESVTDLG
jgi:excisionase family DNA binding protein